MLSKETLDYILTYINDIEPRYAELIGRDSISQKETVFGQILSLAEEIGEMNEQIKLKFGLAFNKEKQKNYKETDLEDEIVDVLICQLVLVKTLGIKNLDEAVKRKIAKNNKRGY